MAAESVGEELESLLKRKPIREDGASFPLTFFEELSIHENAVKGSSHLSNDQLKMRMLRDGGELLHRAYKGDREAVRELAVLARNLANELNLFAKRQPDIVRDIAKLFDEWPVVLSLIDKKKDAESWHRFLKEKLNLGEDSFCCTDRRQKIDLTIIWNWYAWFALKAMRLNKTIVPLLRERCKSSLQVIQQNIPVGRNVLRTKFYELPKETVMITEWSELCCDLPDRLTNNDAVIDQFMKVLKLAVLEYWNENQSEYDKAKSQVKSRAKFPTEANYRSLCFTQLEQSLRTLAGK